MGWIKPTAFFITFFIFWLLLISVLWLKPLYLTIVLLTITCLYFVLLKERKGIYYFLAAAIFGPIGEAIVSANGLWTYHGETIFGIPYWLPLAWGITAVALHKYLVHVGGKS
ncbi:MAG: hypothetical protein G01um101493_347 [Microgenomates group bacterium Gr01-1014_93]|nr:MAG: hypothetical protein G01um101493_347 [Microgenomates group bacterium Gr01-1014_93]